ncbi:hypothetical protein FIBSPDRAFT_962024 [Athelia psychrophila]|uniref:Uncharacterized protein n=1 Tax=Athelia psychrophila TaxID=1759441 RepID=A0A166AM20_9AGAM|nr:hypothetical protein FIBSPDRAFT_962024 [Fibularhizoctonia sp. CBS 109695]
MARQARIHYVSLKSSLVNLPNIYGPLLERSIATPSKPRSPSDSPCGQWRTQDRSTIEIDSQYAMGLGLAQGAVVEIGFLHDLLPLAKPVGAEPVSADDREIIGELHADHVEDTLPGQGPLTNRCVSSAVVPPSIRHQYRGKLTLLDLAVSLDTSSQARTISSHGAPTVVYAALRCMRAGDLSALLNTGRAGAGKTYIAKAVAQRVQVDPRGYAYTLYIDHARHAKTPVPALKGLFTHWWAKAVWHRPSVIVSDNHADSFRTRHLTGPLSRSTLPPRARPRDRARKPPNKDARRDTMVRIVERMETALDIKKASALPLTFTSLATRTEGYPAPALHDLVARATH